ncbi:unnamed protein product [Nippostrongylus brasiliensis]|uniref:Replication factor C subunit 1 n=1 Tax=Nippostrongylus brasiliensis TaxID=27835 RepID=A0A0N4YGC9_NIPBR|nr:hypothetical protein Q1695_002421 [Nippostrongylus brasiliensis]VDL79456.1 unnamed protein product [Nippostrongylus brasiliensis]
MDIRSFFGAKKDAHRDSNPGTSASPVVRNTDDGTTKTQDVKRRSQKLDINTAAPKKGRSKKETIPVVNLSESDDSEGESPLPASLRKEAKKQKRAHAPRHSGSDDDQPRKKHSKSKVVSASPSPVKPSPMKRSRVVVCDDSDESPNKKRKVDKKNEFESGDEEDASETTDSEDEFKEKKKPMKAVSRAGQKNQSEEKPVKKPMPRKEKKPEKEARSNDNVRSKDAVSTPPKKDIPPKGAKISPSQKENAVQEKRQKVNDSVRVDGPPLLKPKKTLPQEVAKPKLISVPSAASTTLEKRAVFVPWVDKYKPKNAAQLVGQHGEKSPMNKLSGWLKDWARNNLGEGGKVKKPKPPPFMAQSDGAPFKAVLLSGSPGVGKTTCAVMACESLGLKMVEMNASDVRSKKSMEQQIAQLTESHQIEEYFTGGHAGNDDEVSHVLIMDEVDGMSGTEDRAGISELIQIIKDTKIPIICICNDRQHPKIRSLANYCFDVRFQKPRVEQIRARMMSIACQEKVKISKEELDQMIELSGHDVRQSIYNLQLYASAGGKTKVQKKDVAVGPFEAARKLLDPRSTLQEKQDMFFVDYGIMPLFVQENYINMRNDKHTPKEAFAGLRKAADLISHGDTIDRCIRSTGTWKLLNEQAMLGCALPSIAVDGYLRAMIQFPSWLGKNSTANKRQRLTRQLATHAHLKISSDMRSLVTDYVPILRDCLTKPLLERETDGVFEVVCMMNDYDLIREDTEAVSELAVWPGKIDPASKILPKVKAALTRALNKEHRTLPYATDDIGKSRRKVQQEDYEIEYDEEGNIIERSDGEESGFEDDSGDEDYKPGSKSKAKPKPAAGAARGRGRGGSAGGTSRGGGAKRGRGK